MSTWRQNSWLPYAHLQIDSLYLLRLYIHLLSFHTKNCNIILVLASVTLILKGQLMLQELQKNFHLLQRTAITTKFFGVLSNFYWMISSKGKLGPYHMHVKLAIIIHCLQKWLVLLTLREKKCIFTCMFPLCQNFIFLGMLGCVLMSPD